MTTATAQNFTVDTHGNRHRLSITAAAADGNVYFIDSAAAANDLPDWADFGIIVAGQYINTGLDSRIAAAMIAKALKEGMMQPRHIYRVPLWSALDAKRQQALFNLIMGL